MNRPPHTPPALSVVIPLFREGGHLRDVLRTIGAALDALDAPYELVLVDDGSDDETWTVVEETCAARNDTRGIRLSRNFGKEAALCAGLEAARGQAVLVMDGDLQHPPALIAEMWKLWKAGGVDVVEAVKVDRGREPLINRLGSRLFYGFLSRFSGYDLDNSTDFKLMDRRVVDAWLRLGERNLFFRGMNAWLGFVRVQVPFEVAKRAAGASHWSLLRLVRLAITGVTAFSTTPLHIVTFTGGLFLLAALGLGLQTLFNKLDGRAVDGFTTVILLQLIIGSLLMISLGVIGTYIAKIYREVKGRPRFIVREQVGMEAGPDETA